MSTTPAVSDKERYHRYLCSREWGLLRDQVRRRCGGICERCRRAPMSHVHHLTYIRKYNELLEDLQGLCEPCHTFTHGKSDHDPIADGPVEFMGEEIARVYLAGKISDGCGAWRQEIVPNWHTSQCGAGQTIGIHEMPEDDVARIPDGREIIYAGPYWLDVCSGHGGGVGPHAFGEYTGTFGHGLPDEIELEDPADVARYCYECVKRADMVFAWLDSRDCLGTLLEIGWAKALNKILVVATPKWDRELWLACASADRFIMADSAGKAWEWLWTHPTMTHRLGAVRDDDSYNPNQEDDREWSDHDGF